MLSPRVPCPRILALYTPRPPAPLSEIGVFSATSLRLRSSDFANCPLVRWCPVFFLFEVASNGIVKDSPVLDGPGTLAV